MQGKKKEMTGKCIPDMYMNVKLCALCTCIRLTMRCHKLARDRTIEICNPFVPVFIDQHLPLFIAVFVVCFDSKV